MRSDGQTYRMWGVIEKTAYTGMFLFQFKERDMLEGVFKFWRQSDEKVFNIKQNWWVCIHTGLFSLWLG